MSGQWPIVTQGQIEAGLRAVGLGSGDTVFFHSSLSSFGYVVNGADAVIDAFLNVVGPSGTVVVPTFVLEDRVGEFGAWWDPVTTPSSVGRVTEVFRQRPGARRSDHPIHSVAAIGAAADEITRIHRAGGERIGPWEGSFSIGSPFDKLLDRNATYLLAGVSFQVQTLCHMVETQIVIRALARAYASDVELVDGLRRGVRQVFRGPGVWPGFDRVKLGERLLALGAWRQTQVGNAAIYSATLQPYFETVLGIVEAEPDAWLSPEFLEWYARVPGISVAIPAHADMAAPATASSVPPPPADMAYVPAGWFVRGSLSYESDARPDETPQRLIFVDAFYLDRHPVTNVEYERFVEATGHRPPPQWRRGRVPVGLEHHPVSYVDWTDARAFAAWAGKRLPTEAEWEKAARGGVFLDGASTPNPDPGRRFPWGSDFDPARCATSEGEAWAAGPVGTYSPAGDSPYGAADLAGGSWEWVADWYDPSYYPVAPERNPTGPAEGTLKVLRGGAAGTRAKYARCACRTGLRPDRALSTNGFRCAWSPL